MNIVVPLAGKDDSFQGVFGDLKPFVDIEGTSLIELALGCLPFNLKRVIFVCLREDEKNFAVSRRLKAIFGNEIKVVFSPELTEGSACSVLLAEQLINNENPLLIDLADVYFDPLALKSDLENNDAAVKGVIPICREAVQNKPWGYVYLDGNSFVKSVSEKEINPSSKNATLGLYYFNKGSDFVRYAKWMVKKNLKVHYNKLFYVAPVYNLFIRDGGKIRASDTKILHLLGSPREVLSFISSRKS